MFSFYLKTQTNTKSNYVISTKNVYFIIIFNSRMIVDKLLI